MCASFESVAPGDRHRITMPLILVLSISYEPDLISIPLRPAKYQFVYYCIHYILPIY